VGHNTPAPSAFSRCGRRSRVSIPASASGRERRRRPRSSDAHPCASVARRPILPFSAMPTWEASFTSFVISSAARISPVSASIPIGNFRQERRVLVPRFSISHSPVPQNFNGAGLWPRHRQRLSLPAQMGWTAHGSIVVPRWLSETRKGYQRDVHHDDRRARGYRSASRAPLRPRPEH
jgi:hypothetical protein